MESDAGRKCLERICAGGAACPDGEQFQRLFECLGVIAVIMGVGDSRVDQAVTNMQVPLFTPL